MDVFYLASHYPFSSRHAYPDHHQPEPEVFRVDMESNDFAHSKPLSSHHHLHIPAPQYTSSPSLDSQTDDEEKLFDVDVDFTNIHPHQNQLMYDPTSPWANIATPRAWVGEPHKVPALEPDSHSPFGYPQETNISNNNNIEDPSTNMPLYTLADYLHNPSPVHSPPSTFVSSPGSVALTAPILTSTSSFYSPPSADAQPHQQSPYALAARYSSSLQAHDMGCDPRFVSPVAGSPHAGPSSLPAHQNVGISFADVYTDPTQDIKIEQDQQSVHIGSSNIQYQQPVPLYDSDSGEDEKSECESDPSYMPSSSRSRPMSLPNVSHVRPRHMRSSSAGSSTTIGLGGESPHAQRPARTPAPEPVPNLTKKSRGRRVPTAAALYGSYGSTSASPAGAGGKNARTYVCKVKECGKCFARSEHLKRHVRSIHTNEKRAYFLLPRVPSSLMSSPLPQPTVAHIQDATKSLVGMITYASTCVCTVTFRHPRTAHLALFDRIDRISQPHPTYTTYTPLFARTRLLHCPTLHVPCLYCPVSVSLRLIMYPVVSLSAFLTRLAPSCHAGLGQPRSPLPYRTLLYPTAYPSPLRRACFQSERDHPPPRRILPSLPMIIIPLSFRFCQDNYNLNFIFQFLLLPISPSFILIVHIVRSGSNGGSKAFAVTGIKNTVISSVSVSSPSLTIVTTLCTILPTFSEPSVLLDRVLLCYGYIF